MFKKLIALSLFTALLIGCTLPARAVPGGTATAVQPMEATSTGENFFYRKATGETVIKAYSYNESGELIALTLEEYLQIQNSVPSVPGDSEWQPYNIRGASTVSNTWYYDYRETDAYVALGDSYAVTADVKGPATIQHTQSATIQHSFGGSVTLDGATKLLIQTGASFDWHTSLSSGVSNSYTFEVPSGKIGYVQFTPYLNYTEGEIYLVTVLPGYMDEMHIGDAWGACPIEIPGGFANGIFELILR